MTNETNEPKPAFVLEIEFVNTPPPPRTPVAKSFDPADVLKALGPEIEAKDLSRLRFAQIIANAIVAHCPMRELISVTAAGIVFNYDEGEEQIGLDSAWQLCGDHPGERTELLYDAISSIAESVYDKKPRVEDVVAVVRSQKYFDDANEGVTDNDLLFFGRTIAPGLICMLASETEHSLSVLTNRAVRELGVDLGNNMQDGPVRTMLSRLPMPEIRGYQVGNDIFMLTCGGAFESSLILDESLMKTFSDLLEGNLIFSVPNRDILLMTGSSNAEIIEEMKGRTDVFYNSEDRVISNDLFIWRDGKIQLFERA